MASRKGLLIRTLWQHVIETIAAHDLLKKGDGVLCALSGGADSVFLLHFLSQFQRYYKIQLAAIHVHHGLRGKHADADEQFCKDLCTQLQVPFISIRKNVRTIAKKKKLSLEEAGRHVRYEAFSEELKRLGFTKVATAHHADDNLESILLNVVKGCGVDGLRGIAPMLDGYVIRPLLHLSKKEICDAMEESEISYMTDASNLDNSFERNKIRNTVVPVLRDINPSIGLAAARLAESAREFSQLGSQMLSSLRATVVTEPAVNRKPVSGHLIGRREIRFSPALQDVPLLMQTALFRLVLAEQLNLHLTARVANQVAALFGKRVGSKLDIGGGQTATRERDGICIGAESEKQKAFFQKALSPGKGTKAENYLFSVRSAKMGDVSYGGSGWTEFIDGGNIVLPLTVRYWHSGDVFQPLGMKNMKKLSDFLTEQKVPSRSKARQLVVCSGDSIIWVPGLRISEICRIRPKTTTVLRLSAKLLSET